MNVRGFLVALFTLGLNFSAGASDAEIDACASANDKIICIAKVFNRKLDILTSAIQGVTITYYDESNCTVPWGNGSINVQSLGNATAVESFCAGIAEQVKNVSTTNSSIESVKIGDGACNNTISISRTDTAGIIADCKRRVQSAQ